MYIFGATSDGSPFFLWKNKCIVNPSFRRSVATVGTDAAEREQRVLAHFAEPRGGKATNVG